jgi:hypothetical protein
MPDGRPAIPRPLQRRLKEEAGYRCAIPRCGQIVGLVYAHIEPWAVVQEHTFDNLIVLCTTCHTRFDIVKDIPKRSVIQYKRNLSLLSHRYTQVENQVLRHFGKIAAEGGLRPGDYGYAIHPGMTLLFTNLFEDGLFTTQAIDQGVNITVQGVEPNIALVPTNEGSDFIIKMVEAGDLEQ